MVHTQEDIIDIFPSRFLGSVMGVPIPFVCKLRKERMKAIGEELSKGEYDIILLQEVWDKADYRLLQEKTSAQYPHCQYFYSGMLGSGVCVFSKIPIRDSCFHKYSLHGYPHRLLDDEWLGGKGVGLCQMEFCGLKMNIYSTHLLCGDRYCYPYKISQAFELSEFIKLTSTDADLIIVGGDFNLQSESLGFNIITKNAELYDTWTFWCWKNGIKESGNTCLLPSNSFSSMKGKFVKNFEGIRLDYLLFKTHQDVQIDVEKCNVTFGRIPGKDFNYSDHEGLAAVFKIEPQKHSGTSPIKSEVAAIAAKHDCLEAAIPILKEGLRRLKTLSYIFGMFIVICVYILYITSSLDPPYGLNVLVTIIRVALTIAVGAAFWARTVLNDCVKHSLIDTQENIQTLLKTRKVN